MKFCYSCMCQLTDEKQNTCPHCGEPLGFSAAAPNVLPPGTVLQGRFIIGKVLGSGGFGNTYIGWNNVLSCRVAIKEFFPRHMSVRNGDRRTISVSGATMQERYNQSLQSFLEEARRLAELGDIPGIPDVYGYFQENGTGYIVMEYLEGITVKQLLKDSGGRLDYDWSRQIILSVLYTLKAIHRRGILHRDIAPDNIMITGDGIVQLIDFGVAKKKMDMAADPVIMLKAGYSPPEQYARNMSQGVYTDLYSVAATFYQMVTGAKPASALERMKQDTIQPPSSYGIKIPQEAEMAMMMCLYLKPEYRLESAEDFMTALQGQDFKPVVNVRPGNMPGEYKKSKKKNWEFPLAGKIASIVLLAAVVGMAIVFARQTASDNADAVSTTVVAADVIGMTEEEAAEKLKSQGITFEVTDISFNKNVGIGGQVTAQEPAAGEEVTDGVIRVSVQTSTKCTYADVLAQARNVDKLAEALGIDPSKLTASREKDAADAKKIFKDLYEIVLTDGTKIRSEDLKKEKDSVLNLLDVQAVTYYTSSYVYKKKLENYLGKNIQKIRFQKYIEKDGKRIKKGSAVTPSYEAKYYSFTKKKGYIVGQKIAKGKPYSSLKNVGALFTTVKEKITYDEKNAETLIHKLKAKGLRVKVNGSGPWVASVTVNGKGKAAYFTKKETITVTRKAKPSVPKPKKPAASRKQPQYDKTFLASPKSHPSNDMLSF